MFNSLSLLQKIEIVGLAATTIYDRIASYRDRNPPPPGKLDPTRDRQLRYLQSRGSGDITVIVDASLGGVEGYLLINEFAKLTRVCIYDRSGYGWSEGSFASIGNMSNR